jgi:hypothetical protein
VLWQVLLEDLPREPEPLSTHYGAIEMKHQDPKRPTTHPPCQGEGSDIGSCSGNAIQSSTLVFLFKQPEVFYLATRKTKIQLHNYQE